MNSNGLYYRGTVNKTENGTQCETYCRRDLSLYTQLPIIGCLLNASNPFDTAAPCSINDICTTENFSYRKFCIGLIFLAWQFQSILSVFLFSVCGMTKNRTKFATYDGSYAVTETGWECKNWSDVLNSTTLAQFPSLQENYCRNVETSGDLNKTRAWCYSTNPDAEFEFCDIPLCSNYIG